MHMPSASASFAAATTVGVLRDTQSSLKKRCWAAQNVRHTSALPAVSSSASANRRRTQPPARRNHQSDAAVVQRAAQPRIITSREPRQQLPPESPAELHPRVCSPLGLT